MTGTTAVTTPDYTPMASWWASTMGMKEFIQQSEQAWPRRLDAAKLTKTQREPCISFLNSTRRIKRAHNQFAAWQLAWAYGPIEPQSVAAAAGHFALAVRDFQQPFNADMTEWKPLLRRRELHANKRRSDYNNKVDAKTGLVMHRAPPLGERPRQSAPLRRELSRAMELLAEVGYDISAIQITKQTKGNRPATNLIDWMLDFAYPKDCLPQDRAFISAHLIRACKTIIQEVRCSWVKYHLGAPAIVTPDGIVVWLGPYWGSLKGQANRMKDLATYKDEDPRLFGILEDGIWRRMEHDEHLDRLRTAMQREDITVNFVIRTGIADGFARNCSVEYVQACMMQPSEKQTERFEDLEERVHLAVLEGDFAVLRDPIGRPASPGYRCCPDCNTESPVGQRTCSGCQYEFLDDIVESSWLSTALGIFRDVLTLRGPPLEDAERRFHSILRTRGDKT